MQRRPWTTVEMQMIREFYPIMPTAALAKVLRRPVNGVYMQAAKLGLRKTPEYLAGPFACRLRRGDNVGTQYRFKPGQVPANKGVKGYNAGGRSVLTRFKPGQRPHTWKPVGSYRVNADGYLDRKVTDTGYPPRDWVAVHRLVWIEAHGPIPAGHAIAFKPGRRSTELEHITVDAVELVSRADVMRRNSVHGQMPPELARLVLLRGALIRKINRREGRKA